MMRKCLTFQGRGVSYGGHTGVQPTRPVHGPPGASAAHLGRMGHAPIQHRLARCRVGAGVAGISIYGHIHNLYGLHEVLEPYFIYLCA